jgi:putative membrane protein
MCGWDGNGWMWHGWGWGGWIVTALVLVAIFALVIATIVAAVRYFTDGQRGTSAAHQGQAAEDVLTERFARGEIDADEFRRRVTLLREHR